MKSDFLNPRQKIEIYGRDVPHWQQDSAIQFVTFRLKDSVPQEQLREFENRKENWHRRHPEPWDEETKTRFQKEVTMVFETWLDRGSGNCLLRNKRNRDALESCFRHDEGSRAEFISWVIMPNHVHLLFRPLHPLSTLIRNWKSISAKTIGKGSIWQRNYRDTMIRDGRHLARAVRYIRKNPVNLSPSHFSLWESKRATSIQ